MSPEVDASDAPVNRARGPAGGTRSGALPLDPTRGRRPLDSRQGRALGTRSLVGVRERGAEAIGSIHRSGGRCWNGLRGWRRRRCWRLGRRSRRWRTGSVAAIHASGQCYRRFGWNPASPRPGIDAATSDIRFAARVGRKLPDRFKRLPARSSHSRTRKQMVPGTVGMTVEATVPTQFSATVSEGDL